MNNPATAMVTIPTPDVKVFEERKYQTALISAVLQGWRDKLTSQLVEAPPGAGKTVMGFRICRDIVDNCQELFGCEPHEVGFGWVAMRSNLLTQAAKENAAMVNCPNVHYISMFDKEPDKHLANYKFKVIIIDEAHHESTDSAHHLLNVVDPIYCIGLSATPVRGDKAKLCFQKTHKEAGFYTLIEQGYLSKFGQWMLEEYSPRSVAGAYLSDREKWGKSIAFFRTIEECQECFNILTAAGVRADIVTGKTDRFQQIDDFEDDKTDFLINMFVLTEGFDCPALGTVWVRDSTQGPTVQMAGRVLRKFKNRVKHIVQSVNTEYPFTRIARALTQSVMVKGEWRSVGVSELAKIMEAKMLERIMHIKVVIPDYIKKMEEKGRRHRRNASDRTERLQDLGSERTQSPE